MKLIVMTQPEFFVEEDKILSALFDNGLDLLHLRKPGSEPVYCERLLTLLPNEHYRQIVTHDHFYLHEEFGLRGIHLSPRNPEKPNRFQGRLSRTVHTIDELREQRGKFDYIFLSPTFGSISKSDFSAPFTTEQLQQASREGLIDRRVFALGGVTIERAEQIKDLGFGGAVVLGDLWNRFKIHSTRDYREVIRYFYDLRKAFD